MFCGKRFPRRGSPVAGARNNLCASAAARTPSVDCVLGGLPERRSR